MSAAPSAKTTRVTERVIGGDTKSPTPLLDLPFYNQDYGYHERAFLADTITEELTQTSGRPNSYTVTVTGPILNADGKPGRNKGVAWWGGRWRANKLDDLPDEVWRLILGPAVLAATNIDHQEHPPCPSRPGPT